MSPDRFKALAEAYGGDLGRWPRAERGEAERLLAATPVAWSVLSHARALDKALAGYVVAPPVVDVGRRIANDLLERTAPRTRMRRWLSGLGAMGVLGAGAIAGAAAMALVVVAAPAHREGDGISTLYEQSGFGNLIGSEDATTEQVRS